jgi:hypothetical protein
MAEDRASSRPFRFEKPSRALCPIFGLAVRIPADTVGPMPRKSPPVPLMREKTGCKVAARV